MSFLDGKNDFEKKMKISFHGIKKWSIFGANLWKYHIFVKSNTLSIGDKLGRTKAGLNL